MNKWNYFLFISLLSILCNAQEPNDCINATLVCGNINFTYTPTGPGTDDFLLNPNPDCLPNDPVESQSVWLRLDINDSGSLEFVITPNNGTDDYDWAIYGPNPACGSLGTPIRCSSTMFLGNGETGLGNGAIDTTEGPGTGDAFLAPLNVISGQSYFLWINNWSNTSSGFDLEFGGTATFNDPPVNETPIATSIDIQQCDTDGVLDGISEFDLTVNTPIIIGSQTNVEVRYFETDGDAQVGTNPITNASNYNNKSNPQTIYARITSNTNDCFETTEFEIKVLDGVNIGIPNNLYLCDDNNDGFGQFDLSQNNTLIINGNPNAMLSYHKTENEANTNTNPLANLYTNSVAYTQEVIWVRLENTTTGCYSTTSFNLNVYDTPIANVIPEQNICDDNNDGFWSFDFQSLNAIALGTQSSTDFTVLYFSTQLDADNSINELTLPYTNQNAYQSEDIFYRIENNLNTNCYVTSSFQINVFNTPTSTVSDFELCDNLDDGDDTNGIVEFDLSTKTTEVLGTLLPADFRVKYYFNQADADAGLAGTDILTPIQNITNPQPIYVRVENVLNTNCYITNTFNLVVNPLPAVVPVVNLTQCDDDTDGFSPFNLTEANTLISVNANNEIFTYYLTQAQAETGFVVDQITNFINYINPIALNSNVYARVETINGCYRTAQINLIVGATQIPANFKLTYNTCDDKLIDGDNRNGVAAFNFSNATAQIEALFPIGQNLSISYYTNETDALAETNAIPDIANHRNVLSPNVEQIYVRVDSNDINACLGLGNHITLIVDPQPANFSIADYVLCSDTDQTFFDLTTKNIEVIGTQAVPILISYHLTEQDAIDNIPITNANAYTNVSNPQTIYVRSQFDTNNNGVGDVDECFNTDMSFNLVVNPNPILFAPDEIQICNEQVATMYDLTIREDQISGGDTSISFSYFETQIDLDNNNPIPDPTQFLNLALNNNVIVLATGVNMCTSTIALPLQTILYENFNVTPTPIEECEIDNNGFDYFDITRRETEILNGLDPADFVFLYYELESDAIAENSNNITNVFNFLNTQINTQIIYVRVQPVFNQCYRVIPLQLVVNPVPEIAIEDKYVICLNSNDEVTNPRNMTFLPVPPMNTQLSTSEYTIQWYQGTEAEVNTSPNDVILVGETDAEYFPVTTGFYTVVATDINTGCRIPATTEVVASYPPESITVELVSETFADNNIIEVNVVGNGIYEYNLDGGIWQSEPRFENVTGGEHIIYVRDVYNCNEIWEMQIVIDYPRYLTPNNDGYHDSWNIYGLKNQPNAKIFIFDRFGKLLKQLHSSTNGWDGTFNGFNMPTSDYWFVVEFDDPHDNVRKQFKAHFTLKR